MMMVLWAPWKMRFIYFLNKLKVQAKNVVRLRGRIKGCVLIFGRHNSFKIKGEINTSIFIA
jgi:hypothetical protein